LDGSVGIAALSAVAGSRSKGSGNRGKAVLLCPFDSDSRFNGPGMFQIQRKAKVDAEVVGRNSDGSRAPPAPTRVAAAAFEFAERQLTTISSAGRATPVVN
jgi:hypothetical protein